MSTAFEPFLFLTLVVQLMGCEIPEAYGGPGASFFVSNIIIEELSKVDASIAVCNDVHNTLVVTILLKYGTEQQKQKYLPKLMNDTVSIMFSYSKSLRECVAVVLLVRSQTFKSTTDIFLALLTADVCAYDHHSSLTGQAPRFCTGSVSEKCLMFWSTYVHKQFLAFKSANSLLMVGKAMKFISTLSCKPLMKICHLMTFDHQ